MLLLARKEAEAVVAKDESEDFAVLAGKSQPWTETKSQGERDGTFRVLGAYLFSVN